MHGKRGAGEWEGCPQQGLRTRWLRRPKGRSLVLTVNVKFPAMLLWAGWLAPGLTHQGWGLLCCNCLCAYNYSRVKSKTVCVHVCVYLGIRIYLDMCVCIWMCACIHGNVYRAGERRFTVVSMQSRVYSGISVY